MAETTRIQEQPQALMLLNAKREATHLPSMRSCKECLHRTANVMTNATHISMFYHMDFTRDMSKSICGVPRWASWPISNAAKANRDTRSRTHRTNTRMQDLHLRKNAAARLPRPVLGACLLLCTLDIVNDAGRIECHKRKIKSGWFP